MIEFELSEASPIRKSAHHSYGTGQFSMGASGGPANRNQASASAARHPQYSQNPAGSSSVNLEKAYEELEKEI